MDQCLCLSLVVCCTNIQDHLMRHYFLLNLWLTFVVPPLMTVTPSVLMSTMLVVWRKYSDFSSEIQSKVITVEASENVHLASIS